MIGGLQLGFSVALASDNLLYCMLGALIGTVVGILPGLGPVTSIAMLLPLTFKMSPTEALIMLSGIYDLTAGPLNEPDRSYFGNDPSRYAGESSLPGLLKTDIPLMAVSAELDPPVFVGQLEKLKEATCKRPAGCARTRMLPQHSHMSEVYSINTDDTRLTDQILDFVKTGR